MPEIDFSGIQLYPAGSTYGPQRAPEHELVWVEEGSAAASSDELTVAMRPGSVLLSPKGSRTRYVWDEQVTTRHGFVLFRAPHVERFSADFPTGDVVPALLRHVVHLDLSRPEGWYADAQQALAVALRAMRVPRASVEPLLSPVVLESLEAVRKRWARQGPWPAVPLGELACEAGVTPEYLCRAWTKEVGESPVAALRAVRLYRAAFLLTRSNTPVSDVAHTAGFDSPFHFSRAFKSVFGMSPTEFRQTRMPPSEVPAGLRSVMARL